MEYHSEASSFRNQVAGNVVKMSWKSSRSVLKIRPLPCSTQENKVLQMPGKLHIYFCTYPLLPHLFGKAEKPKVKGYNYYSIFVHWTSIQETVIDNSQEQFGDIL